MGTPVAEPAAPESKPSISDKEQAKALDTAKVAADAAREKEVQAAASAAIAASKKQENDAKNSGKDMVSVDEHWTANMPSAYTNVELDIASDSQVNFAMDQYRAAHMF